jgi:hypothetical protein
MDFPGFFRTWKGLFLNHLKETQGAEPDGVRALEGSRSLRVFSRLPAFYREDPSRLAPFVDLAEGLLRDFVARAEDLLGGREELPSLESAGSSSTDDVIRWLEERCGTRPLCWNGFQVEPLPGGNLELRRAFLPSVVFVWQRQHPPRASVDLDLPPSLLPVCTKAQIVLAARLSRSPRPLAGQRIQGEVLGSWSVPRAPGPLELRKSK